IASSDGSSASASDCGVCCAKTGTLIKIDKSRIKKQGDYIRKGHRLHKFPRLAQRKLESRQLACRVRRARNTHFESAYNLGNLWMTHGIREKHNALRR